MLRFRLVIFPIVCFFLALSSFADSLKIHFIDVGEGDAILVETPSGKAVLVDSGNLTSGFKLREYIKRNSIERLDKLILTHPHFDHIGGAFFLVPAIKISHIYDNGEKLDLSQDIHRWYGDLIRKDPRYKVLRAQDEFSLDGVSFRAIWPPDPLESTDFNSNSLVVMVEYRNFRCLLAGDLNGFGEKELLGLGIDLTADILKVAHHAADDASSSEFIKAVSPEISIISVNQANIRGYPSKKVSERLKESGSKVYYTYKSGNILISLDEKGKIQVKEEK
mgnify:CR=1 FL=1